MPNSYYPKYRTYKIELHPDEWELPIGEIRQLDRSPRPSLMHQRFGLTDAQVFKQFLQHQSDGTYEVSQRWLQEVADAVEEAERERQYLPVDSQVLTEQEQGFIPTCVAELHQNGPKVKGSGNLCQLVDATFSLLAGRSRDQAAQIMDGWTRKYHQRHSTGKQASKQQNLSIINTVFSSADNYTFSCGAAIAAGLPCSGASCPLWQKLDLRKHSNYVRRVKDVEPPKMVDSVSVEDARVEMEGVVADYVEGFQEGDPILLINAEAGSGKTTTVLNTLDSLNGHVIYSAPRHAILSEHTAKRDYFRIKARNDAEAAHCIMPKVCDDYARKRYNVVSAVCYPLCEMKFNCGYRDQFVPRDSAIVHQHLFSKTYMDWLCRGEDDSADSCVVVDEPSIDGFLEQVLVRPPDLTRAIQHYGAWPKLRRLLAVVRDVVETLSVEGRHIGDAVLLRIEKRAVFLGLNLFGLVESAQRELRVSSGDCQVPFDSWLGASRSGKGLLFQIDERAVWLPTNEVTVNEGLKIVELPRWLALDKELLLSNADADDEPSELRLEFVKDLVDYLAADLAKGGGFNSALVLEKRQDKAMLRMNLKRDFGHVKGPVIALNAYMDAVLLSVLTGREVQSWSVPVKMEGTEVIQFTDGYYGKTTLMDKMVSPNHPQGGYFRESRQSPKAKLKRC